MFPDSKQFIIQGGNFFEQHIHGSPAPPPPFPWGDNTPEERTGTVVPRDPNGFDTERIPRHFPPGQYLFINCNDSAVTIDPSVVRYINADALGVAEVFHSALPGLALAARRSIATLGETPTQWFFERIDPGSEWYYISTYTHPRKVISGHVIKGSLYDDLLLEEKIPGGSPVQLWKPEHQNTSTPNAGLIPAGQYTFTSRSGALTSHCLLRYKEPTDVPCVAEIAMVEKPGQWWYLSPDQSVETGEQRGEWFLEFALGSEDLSVYIYPRGHPNRVLTHRVGSDIDLEHRVKDSDAQLWTPVPRHVPINTGGLLAGNYEFLGTDTMVFLTSMTIKYGNDLDKLGVARISAVAFSHQFFSYDDDGACEITTEANSKGWTFELVELPDIYYISPVQFPSKVLTGLIVDGDPDFILIDKDPATTGQKWKAAEHLF